MQVSLVSLFLGASPLSRVQVCLASRFLREVRLEARKFSWLRVFLAQVGFQGFSSTHSFPGFTFSWRKYSFRGASFLGFTFYWREFAFKGASFLGCALSWPKDAFKITGFLGFTFARRKSVSVVGKGRFAQGQWRCLSQSRRVIVLFTMKKKSHL